MNENHPLSTQTDRYPRCADEGRLGGADAALMPAASTRPTASAFSQHGAARHLTSAQLAERWGVSVRTVQRLTKAGELRCVRIGRQIRFRLEDILAYERKSRS